MRYTTAGALLLAQRAEKEKKFKEILSKAKGDAYRYDPATDTHKLKEGRE